MFGKRLKALRESKDLTQQELANKLGMSVGTIGMYEIEKRLPNNKNRDKLARFFNVSHSYLLGYSDDPTPNDDISILNKFADILNEEHKGSLDLGALWDSFLTQLPEDQAMHHQDVKYSDEQKIVIMELDAKVKQKKRKKIEKFMNFSDEVIDEALNFAAYNDEQRKKKLDEN